MKETVLKHFENAKEITCLIKGKSWTYDVSEVTVDDVILIDQTYYIKLKGRENVAVFKNGEFAPITEYKENIKEIAKNNFSMSMPSLEEVKEYFKDAKVVRCLHDEMVFNILKREIFKDPNSYLAQCDHGIVVLWRGKYAEIITTKELKEDKKPMKEELK